MHRVAGGLADPTDRRLAGAARRHAQPDAVGAAQLHHAAIALDLAWPLVERGLVRKSRAKSVVVLGQGQLQKSLHVTAHRFSATARQKIEAAGGKAEEIAKPVAT